MSHVCILMAHNSTLIIGFKVYNHTAQNLVYDFKCQNVK